MLLGKKILLGVSGSIAAYKAAFLVRLLVKAGAEVRVVMTASAKEFITPLTLATLSKNPVASEFTTTDGTGTWNNHVELGLWADAMLVAPASARTLARCAQGLADDLLSAVYLSARCPVFFAPAMDLDMYQHPATAENLRRLTSYGNFIIDAESGELASGLVGQGRLAEPETLVGVVENFFASENTPNRTVGPPLKGAKNTRQVAPFRGGPPVRLGVLITAGPTQEAIDPVRFISNHSTGKMGYALAEALAEAGAAVTLVSGPVHLPQPSTLAEFVPVRSAREMFEATRARFAEADVVILSAAVADYTPAHPADRKIKKKEDTFTIDLTKTVDIAATLGAQKRPGQVLVGFALETDHELENARLKLERKNLDLIVLNSLQDPGAGFGHDTNRVTLLFRNGETRNFELKTKREVADDLVEAIEGLLKSVKPEES